MTQETDKTNEILARLDERTKSISDNMKSMQENILSFKVELKGQTDSLTKKIEKTESDFIEKINKLEERINKGYVNVERYNPVERIVYGIIGIILVSVATGILSYVIVAKPAGIIR